MQENPGMSPAVQAAIQRRAGTAQPALSQMSPGAAQPNPVTQPVNPSEINQASAPPAAPQQKFQPQDRRDLIVMSLTEQLKNDNKLEKEQIKMQGTPAPTSSPAPQNSGMGTGGSFDLSSGFEQPMSPRQMQSNYPQKDYTGLNNYGQ